VKRVLPDERDGDRVTPIDGGDLGEVVHGHAGPSAGSLAGAAETVSSSDGRGWRGVRVLRFRHTSGEVEVTALLHQLPLWC
jgi:hypothetical protein